MSKDNKRKNVESDRFIDKKVKFTNKNSLNNDPIIDFFPKTKDIFETEEEIQNKIDNIYNSFEKKLFITVEKVVGYSSSTKIPNFYTLEMKSLKFMFKKLLKLLKKKNKYYEYYHKLYNLRRKKLSEHIFIGKKSYGLIMLIILIKSLYMKNWK